MQKSQKKNITHLNNYSINKTLENIRQYKRKKIVRMRTGIILVGGLVLIGVAGLPLLNNNQKTNEFNGLYVEAASTLEELEAEKEQLEYQVGLLEDEEYIAKLARRELNLSKPNEILINLPEKDVHTDEDNTNTDQTDETDKEENESE